MQLCNNILPNKMDWAATNSKQAAVSCLYFNLHTRCVKLTFVIMTTVDWTNVTVTFVNLQLIIQSNIWLAEVRGITNVSRFQLWMSLFYVKAVTINLFYPDLVKISLVTVNLYWAFWLVTLVTREQSYLNKCHYDNCTLTMIVTSKHIVKSLVKISLVRADLYRTVWLVTIFTRTIISGQFGYTVATTTKTEHNQNTTSTL